MIIPVALIPWLVVIGVVFAGLHALGLGEDASAIIGCFSGLAAYIGWKVLAARAT